MTRSPVGPPAFVLAAACCQWPPGDERDEAVSRAAARVDDWAEARAVVRQHRVAALARSALRAADVHPPAEIVAFLDNQAEAIVRQNLAFAAEAEHLRRLAGEADMPLVFLKGLPLAQLAYGSIGLKHGKDIDVLVRRGDVLRLSQLLEREGYVLTNAGNDRQRRTLLRYGHEFALVHQGRRATIEIHWRAASNPAVLPSIDATSPVQLTEVAQGVVLPQLTDADLFAYLCVHGASHGWLRLKWLADLNAFLAGRSDADIDEVFRRAEAQGAGLHAAQAMALRHTVFGRRAPPAAAESLAQRRVRSLEQDALEVMVGDDGRTDVRHRPKALRRLALSHFRLGRGARHFAGELRLLLVQLEDQYDWPLPDSLIWLYPFARPLLKRRRAATRAQETPRRRQEAT